MGHEWIMYSYSQVINAVCCLSGGEVEAAYDTTVDKAEEGTARSQPARRVRTLAKLNHVATDTVSTCTVNFTCSNAASLFSYSVKWLGKVTVLVVRSQQEILNVL